MKQNNGKIAIAITAMFVIALSIVGVTYAYFTANVVGNTSTQSVKVTAGELVVNYNSTNQIIAQNIVPGWKSNGLCYYDVESSSGTDSKIVAKCASEQDEVQDKDETDGLVTPATFTVANAGDSKNTAYYAIKLKAISNGIIDLEENHDSDNVIVHLYSGTYSYGVDGTELWSGKLAADDEQIIVKNAESVAEGKTNNYYIILEYKNADYDQSKNMGKTITAQIEVFGVAENGGKWYKADGTQVQFASA